MTKDRPIFSVKPEWETFSGTGAGGQNRNKKQKCVRMRHPPSGAVVTATEERSLERNKRTALRRLSEHPKFKAWVRIQASMLEQGYRDVQDKVDKMMKDESKFKVEFFDPKEK